MAVSSPEDSYVNINHIRKTKKSSYKAQKTKVPKQWYANKYNHRLQTTIKPSTFHIHPSIDCSLTHKVSNESAVEIGDALHASGHVTRPRDFPVRLLLVVIIAKDEA